MSKEIVRIMVAGNVASGKSTIAQAIRGFLEREGIRCEVEDDAEHAPDWFEGSKQLARMNGVAERSQESPIRIVTHTLSRTAVMKAQRA